MSNELELEGHIS